MIIKTNKTLLTLTLNERHILDDASCIIGSLLIHSDIAVHLVSNTTGEVISKNELLTTLHILASLGINDDSFVNCTVE